MAPGGGTSRFLAASAQYPVQSHQVYLLGQAYGDAALLVAVEGALGVEHGKIAVDAPSVARLGEAVTRGRRFDESLLGCQLFP